MAKQSKWDEYETALLLDACVRVEKGTLTKKDAIRGISQALRQRARDRGLEIDEAYRNENGITWQLYMMQNEIKNYLSGEGIFHAKMFRYMVEMYYECRDSFNEILSEIKGENIKVKSKKDLFAEWLSDKVSQNRLSEYFIAATELEDYAKRKNIISSPIWDVESVTVAKKIESRLVADRVFSYLHRKSARNMTELARLFIEYTKEKENSKNVNETINNHKGRIEFQKWLMSSGISENNSMRLVNSVAHISTFLNKNNFLENSIFSVDEAGRLNYIYEELAESSDFNKVAGAAFTFELYALKKYISFRTPAEATLPKNNENTRDTVTAEKENVATALSDKDDERIAVILKESFENGLRLSSVIDRNRLKLFYADKYGAELTKNDDEIKAILKRIGIEQDGRIFVHDKKEQSELLNVMLEDIAEIVKNGATSIYYTELYEKYRQELAEQLKIYSIDVMKEQLKAASHGEYCFGKECIYVYGKLPSFKREVQQVLSNSQQPLSLDDIHENLWYIPIDLIKSTLRAVPGAVNVATNTYFYAPNIAISKEELQDLAELMRNELSQKHFLKDKELRELINANLPSIAINTADFTDRGFRNCLSVLLGNQFDFNGTVIGPKGQSLNTSHIFVEFCRSHESMSLEELKDFATEIKAPINWSSVMMTMVRISKDEFVRKGRIKFDVAATDEVLSELFEGEYMSLKDFKLFLHYPPVGVRWNRYVLESYVNEYSRKFFLLHASFSESDCCGAVVRCESSIKDMQRLVLDVLAHSDEWNNREEALSVLVDKGYIQKKSFSGIDGILNAAKLKRERIQGESKR